MIRLYTPERSWRYALAAGLLLGLSFPPFNLAFLQIPAFLLLFLIAGQAADWRTVLKHGYLAFLIWNLSTTYWLMMATLAGGVAAILANSFLMLIPLLMIRYLLKSRMHPFLSSLFAGTAWASYEFLHHNWDLSWPWLTLGNGWSNFPGIIRYISVTGHLGISFWIIVTAALLYQLLISWSETRTFDRRTQRAALKALGVLLLFPLWSLLTPSVPDRPDIDSAAAGTVVTVVQPNMDSYQEHGGLASVDQLLSTLLDLSGSERTEEARLIVWPENAIDSLIPLDSRFNSRIQDSLRTWNAELITGTGFIEYHAPGEEPPLVRGTLGGKSYNIFNAALHFTTEELPDVYKKKKLVPFVERVPFAEFMNRIDLFGLVNWGEIAGYGKGEETNNFIIGDESTPALICYDSVYPGLVGDFVRGGADFITIVTNDGWWGNTSGHIQHFSYARLRAIEYGKWVVRSANNGISGIIAPDGSVRVETDYWTRTAFTHTIYPSDDLTFYARYGEWFSWLMLVGTFAGLIQLKRRS